MRDRVFRDPVHSLIELSGDDRPLEGLIDTRAFQRLRRVHQMGLAWLVYPGAEHSRFGHALGAFHLAGRASVALGLDPAIARDVKVAALLHDIGHGPLSHTWEQAFSAADHEAWGTRMVLEDPELRSALEAISPALPDTVAAFWQKRYRPTFARKLVSSQVDVDRLDYLLRDGHYSGAGYATFDLDWILHALRIENVREGDDAADLVVDYRRGHHAVEQYLFARSYMYAQVYHHKTVRAAEHMFLKLFARFSELCRAGAPPPGLPAAEKLARKEPLDVQDYLALDDVSVFAAMEVWAQKARDPVLGDLAARLSRRRLFKAIDLGDDPRAAGALGDRVAAVARANLGDRAPYYWAIDSIARIGYDPRDGHGSSGPGRLPSAEELFVVGHPTHGTVPLGRLIEELPLLRPSGAVRLLCAPELFERLSAVAEAWLSENAAEG
ncbi:MAG TPA: HD domain-containing protein [Kofleriaceae bacterium]|nr:HD domain-containing protein [Kofleriaceae bacterium]